MIFSSICNRSIYKMEQYHTSQKDVTRIYLFGIGLFGIAVKSRYLCGVF